MADTKAGEVRPRYRRRKILLRPGYQLRVAGTILLSVLTYSLLLGLLIFYPLHQEFVASATLEQQSRIARVALDIHARLWPAVVVIAVLVAVQSIFVTHRIVGPAFHVGRVLQAFAAGDFSVRARLRRWDQLKELEAVTNTLGEALLARTEARSRREARLRASLQRLRRQAEEHGVPAAVQAALQEMERAVAEPAGE
ncbi:MAG: hypothetical protein ACE147_10680 [Candidatus Methylomirabilales bacterium]